MTSTRVASLQRNNQYVLICCIDNARNVSQILKAVHFKDIATVFASENGLKITVENSKCVQANAFIQASVFQEYTLKEENVVFNINLNILLECLNIFGNSNVPGVSTALKLCYRGYGSPLILALEEGGVVSDCCIQIQEPDDTLDFAFSPNNVSNKVIMKSELLKETWNDLDLGADFLEISVSSNKPNLRFSTTGSLGTIHLDFSKESDIMELFTSTQPQSNRYKISLLKPSFKALSQSTKVSIRIDDRGFLCFQYMIKIEDGQTCFVEYFCAPDEALDED